MCIQGGRMNVVAIRYCAELPADCAPNLWVIGLCDRKVFPVSEGQKFILLPLTSLSGAGARLLHSPLLVLLISSPRKFPWNIL